MPSTQNSRKVRQASASSTAECSRLRIITGLNTLSSKLPCEPANLIGGVVPQDLHATIVIASDWVGFTLPGMIDEPGSFSGSRSSPIPARGPEPSQRMSFAIFISDAASVASAPLMNTNASWAASAANRFGAADERQARDLGDLRRAARRRTRAGAFRPVPTAVPPIASS